MVKVRHKAVSQLPPDLGNHHSPTMTIKNKVYCTIEQYYMKQKALTFGDTQTVRAIMPTKDPAPQKQLGMDEHITDFKPLVWEELNK